MLWVRDFSKKKLEFNNYRDYPIHKTIRRIIYIYRHFFFFFFLFQAVLNTVKTSNKRNKRYPVPAAMVSLTYHGNTYRHLHGGHLDGYPLTGRITGSHGTPFKWPKINGLKPCVFFSSLDGDKLFPWEVKTLFPQTLRVWFELDLQSPSPKTSWGEVQHSKQFCSL